MKNNILFHGSNVTVSKPKILINGYYKDFGYGFYCTNIKRQATRWALTKKVHPLSIAILIQKMKV